MRYEWDEAKSRRNLAKHRISFDAAKLAFDDPQALSQLERIEDGEERWQTIGLAGGIAVLLVVHTSREHDGEEVIRIISARRATRREREAYDEAI